MRQRLVSLMLVTLLVILHGQLWFGRGSLRSVAKLRAAVAQQELANAQASLANDRLTAEIHDLREGLEIVEEIARSELAMVKNNEIYVQIAR